MNRRTFFKAIAGLALGAVPVSQAAAATENDRLPIPDPCYGFRLENGTITEYFNEPYRYQAIMNLTKRTTDWYEGVTYLHTPYTTVYIHEYDWYGIGEW